MVRRCLRDTTVRLKTTADDMLKMTTSVSPKGGLGWVNASGERYSSQLVKLSGGYTTKEQQGYRNLGGAETRGPSAFKVGGLGVGLDARLEMA